MNDERKSEINISGGSIEGDVFAGDKLVEGDIIYGDNAGRDEIVWERINQVIKELEQADKRKGLEAVKDLQAVAALPDEAIQAPAQESIIDRCLNVFADHSDDVLEVAIVAILAGPSATFATVVRNIAQRIKEHRAKEQA